MPKYSASIVSHSFWFVEFQQYIALLNAGWTIVEIRQKGIEDNYFKQSSVARTKDMLNVMKHRISVLDQDYLDLFPQLGVADQKLINLIAIIKFNLIFREFMDEVYRNELILGDAQLHDYEVKAFLMHKQVESAQVASWTDETIRRLTTSFKTFCREAGLMVEQGTYDQIKRPLLDIRLEHLLEIKNEHQILAILGGTA